MGVNSHIFVNGVEICKFKAIYFNIKALCLDNVSKDFSTYNMKRLDYTDISMIFQSIMIVLMLLMLLMKKHNKKQCLDSLKNVY